jgi:SagB-type dehydrogenase family enzyme
MEFDPKSDGAEEMGFSPSELYHENSSVRRTDTLMYGRVNVFNSVKEIKQVVARGLPAYRGSPAVALKYPVAQLENPLDQVIRRRRSARGFRPTSVEPSTLGEVLYLSCGASFEGEDEDGVLWQFRNAPSAGALYAVDTYVLARDIAGIGPGAYLYRPSDHSLGLVANGDYSSKLEEATSLGAVAEAAAFCVALCGVMARAKVKYGERGYRFILLESGHIAQNLLLAATSRGLAGISVGGFVDDEVNALLRLDGCEQAVMYLVFIGYPGEGAGLAKQ